MMTLQWINTAAFAAMIAVNALANLLPIGGHTTGQISEAYPNLFTPAPITFAVWGLIYLLLGLFIVYQWGFLDGGTYSTKVCKSIGPWFAVSCTLNIVWILLWHNQHIGLSTVCIALLFAVLILIQGRLTNTGGNPLQRTMAKAGFSVYYGWIFVAMIANLFVLLAKIGWNGWAIPLEVWTAAVLLIGSVITSGMVLIGGNRLAGITVMWAYSGILIRHLSGSYYNATYPLVIAAAMLGEALILAAVLMPLFVFIFGKWARTLIR